MIRLTYAAYRTVWLGPERFERIVNRIAETGELPEMAFSHEGFEGAINWVRIGDATPEDCPLKVFWRIVQEGDPEAIRQGKVILMGLYEGFEVSPS